MKLQQLKCITAIRDCQLNISNAAERLFTTQPAVSKQLRLLEEELGVSIFQRRGKHIASMTTIGQAIIQCADEILLQESKIKSLTSNHLKPKESVLNIHTSHTIARYILPNTIKYFVNKYPEVSFQLFSIQPSSDKGHIPKGYSDFSIIAQELHPDPDMIMVPAYLWNLSLVMPKDHLLAKKEKISLDDLLSYPLISYEQGATGRTSQDNAFALHLSTIEKNNIKTPNYYMTSMDSELIKTYVKLGFGVGIIASVATSDIGNELVVHSAAHLFRACPATLCFRKGIFLQDYNYDLIYKLFPHLDKIMMEKVMQQSNQLNIDLLFKEINLPHY